MLITFTMVYNTFLKYQFKVPLSFKDGYAFPSGHMHFAFIFWTALAVQYKNKLLKAVAFLMIALVGCCLVYKGYHSIVDVLASIGFGGITIILFKIYNTSFKGATSSVIMGIVLIFIAIMLSYSMKEFQSHLYVAFGALFGATIGYYLNISSNLHVKSTVIKLVIGGAGIVTFAMIYTILPAAMQSGWGKFALFFILNLWITFLAEKTAKVCLR